MPRPILDEAHLHPAIREFVATRESAIVRKALGVGIGDRLTLVRTPAGQFELAPAKDEKSVRRLKGVGAKAGRKMSVEAMNQVIALRRAEK